MIISSNIFYSIIIQLQSMSAWYLSEIKEKLYIWNLYWLRNIFFPWIQDKRQLIRNQRYFTVNFDQTIQVSILMHHDACKYILSYLAVTGTLQFVIIPITLKKKGDSTFQAEVSFSYTIYHSRHKDKYC